MGVWRLRERVGWLTCEQVPQVVGLNCLLVSTPACLPVTDLVACDEAILHAGWWGRPADFDALRERKKEKNERRWYHVNICSPIHYAVSTSKRRLTIETGWQYLQFQTRHVKLWCDCMPCVCVCVYACACVCVLVNAQLYKWQWRRSVWMCHSSRMVLLAPRAVCRQGFVMPSVARNAKTWITTQWLRNR